MSKDDITLQTWSGDGEGGEAAGVAEGEGGEQVHLGQVCVKNIPHLLLTFF
jgi:hypothetical protein